MGFYIFCDQGILIRTWWPKGSYVPILKQLTDWIRELAHINEWKPWLSASLDDLQDLYIKDFRVTLEDPKNWQCYIHIFMALRLENWFIWGDTKIWHKTRLGDEDNSYIYIYIFKQQFSVCSCVHISPEASKCFLSHFLVSTALSHSLLSFINVHSQDKSSSCLGVRTYHNHPLEKKKS